MADKNDVVILNLDRPRILWFGHKALKALSAIMGKPLSELGDVLSSASPEDMEKIMYCAFLTDAKRNGETLKMEDMEDLLDMASYAEITDAMMKAIDAAFGNDDEGKNEKGTAKKKNGTGSGPSK